MILIEYPKCSTCRKARKWLDDNGIAYTRRDIVNDRPTYEELRAWHEVGALAVRKFFNTSGMLYKEMGLKDRLAEMSDDEQLRLLSTDGMLVRRPLVVSGSTVLAGFKEDEWAEKLL